MSEDYSHACERAELLGLARPSIEEWEATRKVENENLTEEDDDTVIQNLDASDESAQRISGGLDELNSILNATQKKINRFKAVCGSLGTLLKVKVGSHNDARDHKGAKQNHSETKDSRSETPTNEETLTVKLSDDQKPTENVISTATTSKKIDINEKMGSHLDKLDSLINKAENAQYSMQYQNKQMRKVLK